MHFSDAAFEASTAVPSSNSSFWQLALSAEARPAQVSTIKNGCDRGVVIEERLELT